MRRNIEIISLIITIALFIFLNAIIPEEIDNQGQMNPFAVVSILVIIALFLTLGFYVFVKSRKQKEIIL